MQSKLLRTGTKLGLCAGALLVVGVMGAASASAATTYTVKAGTATSGTAKVTGKTQSLGNPDNANQIVFVDTTKNLPLGCVAGGAKGVANLGPNIKPGAIGSIKSTTWKTCKGPGGIALTPVQSGTWKIKATGPTSGGITPAAVTGVNAAVSGTGCSFTVTGTATGSYNNATGILALAPVANPTADQKLTVSNASGCFTAITNGDNVTFQANYKLSTPTGALSVKSN